MKNVFRLLLILAVIGCVAQQETSGSAEESLNEFKTEASFEPQYCEEISDFSNLKFDEAELKPAYIVDYELREACICVVYQYSGCQQAKSFLSWNGRWPSEFKPEIALHLTVRNPGMCDMLLTDSACFSIKKLSFGGDQVSVTLNDPLNHIDLDFTKYQ